MIRAALVAALAAALLSLAACGVDGPPEPVTASDS